MANTITKAQKEELELLKTHEALLAKISFLKKEIAKGDLSQVEYLAQVVDKAARIVDSYSDILDFSKKIEKLKQGELKTTGAINQLYKDRIKELNKEFLSEYKISLTKKEMLKNSQDIFNNQAKINSYSIREAEIRKNIADGGKDNLRLNLELLDLAADRAKNMGELIKESDKLNKDATKLRNTLNAQNEMVAKQQAGVKGLSMLFGENSTKVMGIGKAFIGVKESIKAAGDMMKTNPIGAFLIVALALKEAFDQMAEILFTQNKEVVGIQKNLMVSGDEARRIRNEFVSIERSSNGIGSAFETVKNMIEASNELSTAFGASIDFSGKNSRKMVKDQIALTKELELSGEEAGALQKTMSMVGMNEQQIGEMAAKSNIEARSRVGVTFNLKSIMADISKLSAATTLSLMKNPKALSDAVVKAKELGVSIDKMNSMADGLLDIENSIGAQFEASVLTGKNLNFELAREKSLRNDIAGAANEVLKQVGSSVDFTKMNRIQQEAMAKAVGMSRDELAGSLIVQENLNKLGGKAREDMAERLKGLSQEEQTKRMMEVHDEKSAYAAAKKIDAQAKMNAMQEKMYSMLGNVLSILEPIIDGFATLFESISPIVGAVTGIVSWVGKLVDMIPGINEGYGILKSTLTGILTIVSAIYVKKLKSFAMDKISLGIDMAKRGVAMGYNGILLARQVLLSSELAKSIGIAIAYTIANPFKAIAAFGAAVAARWLINSAMSESKSIQDGMISPEGGLLVSGKKGSYQLDKNDTIVAGTDLGKQSKFSGGREPLSGKFDTLIALTNTLIVELKKKSFSVNLDGKKVQKELNEINQPKFAKA